MQIVAMTDADRRRSTKISNIIRAAVDITFQINLRTLNAAVEAARASDAGNADPPLPLRPRHRIIDYNRTVCASASHRRRARTRR
ncbi:methyl-accepting chemotaxis protein [Bosea sp. (in: a-proteobacteria)]|uniref:methyl-accepting chemotaxis protein n=1 Tax=Bosea sp. (in: a-proteobacteria) TaxID=1871050 RepID=UPI00403408EA